VTEGIDLHRLCTEPDPYPRYEDLRVRGPVVRDDGNDEWAVLGHVQARQVLADPTVFDSRAVAARIIGSDDHTAVSTETPLIGLDGGAHARLRRVVSRAFTPRRVGELRGFVAATIEPMLADLTAAGGGDIQHDVFDRLPAMVIAELIGVGEGDHDMLVRWARAMVLGVFGDPDADELVEIDVALGEMTTWMDGEIAGRAHREAFQIRRLRVPSRPSRRAQPTEDERFQSFGPSPRGRGRSETWPETRIGFVGPPVRLPLPCFAQNGVRDDNEVRRWTGQATESKRRNISVRRSSFRLSYPRTPLGTSASSTRSS